MTLRLHDTLSGETRPLAPIDGETVRVYSCGPTVYGPAHIGNFRLVPLRGPRPHLAGAAPAGHRCDEHHRRRRQDHPRRRRRPRSPSRRPAAAIAAFLEDAATLRMTAALTSYRGRPTYIDEMVALIEARSRRAGVPYRSDGSDVSSASPP